MPSFVVADGQERLNVRVSTATLFWNTVMVALVSCKSVMVAVQFSFGQPACAAVGCAGAWVVTEKGVLPFLIEPAGIAWEPVAFTVAGFWPGASFPPWLVQVAVGVAVAFRDTKTSALPRPAREPEAFKFRP